MVNPVIARTEINDICILRLSALGDICQFLPTYNAIKEHYPAANIHWVIGKIEHQLVYDLADVNFIIIDKKQAARSFLHYRKQIKQSRFDLLIHAQTSLRANLLAWMTPATIKLGFDKYRSRELHFQVCNQHAGPAPDQHQVEDFLDLAAATGADTHHIKWNLPVPAEASAFADEHIRAHQPILVINACSSLSRRVHRNWSAAGYAEVARYAHQTYGVQIVLCGGPTELEQQTAARIVQLASIPLINLCGRTSLKQLCAVLHKADALLTSDSGPAHIANAVGSKVIALHAATNPLQIGPYGQQAYWINHYQQAIQAEYRKPADQLTWGARAHGVDVMSTITTDEVKQKIDLIFGR